MKISEVKSVGRRKVYDISIDSENYDDQHYVLENGVVTHNTGIYYSADAIWIIGRQQEKDGKEVSGYNFVINIEKSRHVREKSKIPINVTFEGGIAKWSGLLDVAVQGGFIRKPKLGWYEPVNPETGEVLSEKLLRAKEIDGSADFWKMMLSETKLADFIKEKYTIGGKSLMAVEESMEVESEDLDEVEL